MRLFRFILSFIFFIMQANFGFSISKPNIIKPSAHHVSLRPEIVWNPVKNAVAYPYKIKEINQATGALATIESGTVIATNSFRVTGTLTAGKYYQLILWAVDYSSVKSAKTKLYFQAEEKYIIVGESLFESFFAPFDYSLRGTEDFFGFVVAYGDGYAATANFQLPQGAIITGFETFWNADDTNVSLFRLLRANLAGGIELIASASSDGSTVGSNATTVSTDLDRTTTTIDNDIYQYLIGINLSEWHFFYKAKISYID